MNESQIKVEIDGIEYLKFEPVCKTKSQANNISSHIKRYSGIIRKFDVEESFWSGTKISIECLIPVKHAIEFSRAKS